MPVFQCNRSGIGLDGVQKKDAEPDGTDSASWSNEQGRWARKGLRIEAAQNLIMVQMHARSDWPHRGAVITARGICNWDYPG